MPAAIFKQVTLPPGRYRRGFDASGKPVFMDLTAAKIRSYVNGTNAAAKAGLGMPLYLEHPPKGSADCLPLDKWDEKAGRLRNTAGRLTGAELGPHGEAVTIFEVYDPEVASGFISGKYKATSPQLQPSHTDGKGRTFRDFFAHLAVTGRPRNPDQGPIIPIGAGRDEPLQFSLDDYEGPIQMADDDKAADDKAADGDEADAEKKTQNPDLPNTANDDKEGRKIEAVCALLKELCGVDLAADTDADEFLSHLVTALKTAKAIKDQAGDDDDVEEGAGKKDGGPVVEDRGGAPMQFSLDDVEAGCKGNKLLVKVCRAGYSQLVERLDRMIGRGQIGKALKDRLLGYEGAVQFSDEGDFVGAVSLPQLVDALDRCLAPGLSSIAEQFSLEEKEHAKGDAFRHGDGGDLTKEQAKKMADDLEKFRPGVFGKR